MTSENCSKLTWRSAILRQIEKGCFSRPWTSASTPWASRWARDAPADPVDQVAFALVELLQAAGDRGIGVGLELAEGERLHLLHEFVHADPLGERRVDIHRLAGDSPALLLDWR